ncbi:MAG TPA: hypothetical protein VEA78_11405 [Acidimicrobiales bacterium]|nr:hypothetical protein [Acidimicrobiales bacterium]
MAKAAKKGLSRVGLLRRRALLKGPFGGSRGWTYVWAVLFGARLLKRLTAGKEELLLREEIQPGETLIISGGRRDG